MKSIKKYFFAGLCLFLISFGATPQVNAQTYEVNDFISYQDAIAAINEGTGGATIMITGDFTITANPGTIRNDVTITAETNTDGTPKYTITGNGNNTTIICQPKTYFLIENLNLPNGYNSIFLYLDDIENNTVINIKNCNTSNSGGGDGIVITRQNYIEPENLKIIISNCIANNNRTGILVSTIINGGDVTISNCTTNFNRVNGIEASPSQSGMYYLESVNVYNCIANSNGSSGIRARGNHTTVNNCTANGNWIGISAGGSSCKSIISNCFASENESSGFSCSDIYATNCIASKNNRYGFYMGGRCIINKCFAINNGIKDEYLDYGGFIIDGQSIISNSTAVNNGGYGFDLYYQYSTLVNITAHSNVVGINLRSNFVYNSISYDNEEDLLESGIAYNTVWKTESNNYYPEKHNCTTDNPNIFWFDENGEPVDDPYLAAYYILNSGSSAFGLADKSIIKRDEILERIFFYYGNDDQDFRLWIESIFTEEYINDILSFDQRGNMRSFDGDRYDAGSITGDGNVINEVLLAYSPKKAANYGKCSVIFYGNGFDENTEIFLKKQGENDIIAENTTITNESKCTATFNLHNKKTGKWDIIVNLSDTINVIKNGFELEEYIEPEIELKLLGPVNIRNGGTTSYTVEYSNKGNVNVYCLPVIVEIITNDKVVVEVKERWEYFSSDGVFTDKYATIDGVVHKLDTLHFLSGENNFTTFVTPLIPVIPPYGKGYFTFDVSFSFAGIADISIEIRAYHLQPLAYVDPETSQLKFGMLAADRNSTLWDCLETGAKILWDVAKAVIPGVGCAMQTVESFVNISTYQGSTIGKFGNGAWEVGKVITVCATDVIPGGTAAKMAIKVFKVASDANDLAGHAVGVIKCAEGLWSLYPRIVASCDPNDKIGPVSESGSTWISDRKEFTYVINFENDSKATAPAQEVWITDALDLNVFDINSFEAGIMKIGERMIYDIPFNTQNHTWSIDMRPEIDIILEITLKLDKSSGIASWYFKSIDPATGEVPADALLGFLPPNDDEGSGQGFVMFTIRLKDGLPDDVTVANIASIVFDFNEPIITPEWVNKRDIVPPTSTMLRPAKAIGEVELAWTGSDDASGVYCYDIYMKRENDDYYDMILSKTKTTSTVFTVEDGVKYSFYSIAYDHAGNREPDKTEPDITIPFDSLPFDTYCVTKWNNTFMLNLKKLSEDGFDIVDCEWFKNNKFIGDGFTYSAGPRNKDKLEAGAVYYFQLMTRDGEELFSTYKILDFQKTGLRAYPNPLPQGHTLIIEGTIQGSLVEVYNYLGICVSSTIADGSVTELTLTLSSGIYLVRSNNEIVKVVIK